ncbi:MAG: hypothetical protein WB621_07615 [Candidatus Acidiferrales bacterium]
MGMLMRTVILSAIVLFCAGTAHAQLLGGVINTGGSSINRASALNSHVSATTASERARTNLDASVNSNSKNPGVFVPSTFSTYQDALAEAKLEAALRPTTVAEAARQEQARRSRSKDAAVIQLDEDAQGKLVIAQTKR